MSYVEDAKVMRLNQRILDLWKRINMDSRYIEYFDDDEGRETFLRLLAKRPLTCTAQNIKKTAFY